MKFRTNKILKESNKRREDRLKDYKSFAKWGTQTLDEDGINEWALSKTACQHNFPVSKLRTEVIHDLRGDNLNEATLSDSIDSSNDVFVKGDIKDSEDVGILTTILDKALKRNKQLQRFGDDDRINV